MRAKAAGLAEPPILGTRDRGTQCLGPLGAKTSNTFQKGKMCRRLPSTRGRTRQSPRAPHPQSHTATRRQGGVRLRPVVSPRIYCFYWSCHQARWHEAHF